MSRPENAPVLLFAFKPVCLAETANHSGNNGLPIFWSLPLENAGNWLAKLFIAPGCRMILFIM